MFARTQSADRSYCSRGQPKPCTRQCRRISKAVMALPSSYAFCITHRHLSHDLPLMFGVIECQLTLYSFHGSDLPTQHTVCGRGAP